LVKPWIAALAPLPFGLLLRLTIQGPWAELASAAVYLAGYFIAWRVFGLDQSDRAVLDRLFKKKSSTAAPVAGGE
jgi:hypothetical protein